MKFFTTASFLCAFLVLIEIPENIIARPELPQITRPHEIWNSCGSACESTCEQPPNSGVSCIAVCRGGYFCEPGYIRETSGGKCILPSECSPQAYAI